MTEIDIAAQIARAKALLTPDVIETLLPLFAEQDAAREALENEARAIGSIFEAIGLLGASNVACVRALVEEVIERRKQVQRAETALAERTQERDELRNWIARQLANKNAQIDDAYARGRQSALAHAAPKGEAR